MRATLFQEIRLPEPLTQVQLDQLYQTLRFGNIKELRKRAAEKLVTHHLRLGMSIALSFSRSSKSRLEDCVSVMSLALTKGVHRIEKGAIDSHGNVSAYLVTCIRKSLIRFVCKDRLVSIGIEHTKKKEVKKLYFPERIDQVVLTEGASFLELRELLESAKLTSVEQQIVGRRMLGETDAEIAEHLLIKGRKVNRARVTQIRSGVAKRLTELMK